MALRMTYFFVGDSCKGAEELPTLVASMSPGKMRLILIVQYEIEVGKLCKTHGDSQGYVSTRRSLEVKDTYHEHFKNKKYWK